MIHPSYKELMNAVNNQSEAGEPIVHSRYSIVMGTAKRARQIVASGRLNHNGEKRKALSIAVEELAEGDIHIVNEGSSDADIEARLPFVNMYDKSFDTDDVEDDESGLGEGYDSNPDDNGDEDDEDDDDEDDDDEDDGEEGE